MVGTLMLISILASGAEGYSILNPHTACSEGSADACLELQGTDQLDHIGRAKRGWGVMIGIGGVAASTLGSIYIYKASDWSDWFFDKSVYRTLGIAYLTSGLIYMVGGMSLYLLGRQDYIKARSLADSIRIAPTVYEHDGATSPGMAISGQF